MPSPVETINLVDAAEVADEIVSRLACNELSPEAPPRQVHVTHQVSCPHDDTDEDPF